MAAKTIVTQPGSLHEADVAELRHAFAGEAEGSSTPHAIRRSMALDAWMIPCVPTSQHA